MKEEFSQAVLPNGIRLIHKQRKGNVAHLALMVNTGSRDELENENGLAHCVEHMIFKGTRKRRAFHILSCLDNIGGDLNAYTTKEETCVHASFLKNYYSRAFDLFADIAFNSTFAVNELEKEKEVIIDEINSYKDSPAEEIYDEFENVLFEGHQLGRNILGTKELVEKIQVSDIKRFLSNNYSTSQMVVGSIGDISFEKFKHYAEMYFGCMPEHISQNHRTPFAPQKTVCRIEECNTHLSHCMIGATAFEYNNPQELPFILLNNILGGPAMNSRLNINIREKYGFAYTIESQYNAYSDIGVFGIYMGVDPDSLEKAIELVYKEINKLKDNKLGTIQLHHGKQQLIGQLALSNESGMTELLSAVRTVLMNVRVENKKDIVAKVNAVSADQLLEVANMILSRDRMSTLIFKGTTEE